MARQRKIVGLGEALLSELPDRTEPAGLAAHVALQAVRLGHQGLIVSRVGQDEPARELLSHLSDQGVDVSHVQTDPDLPTGRIIVRAMGGEVARFRESRASFDNLQWDFDLEDLAAQADAVVYGLLSRRGGQTRSEENRFLQICREAYKVFDLTARDDDDIDRGQALTGLELADAALLDATAFSAVHPGGGPLPSSEAAKGLMRSLDLSLLIVVDPDDHNTNLHVYTAGEACDARIPLDEPARTAATVALLHGLLRGAALAASVDLAARIADQTARNAQEPIPEEWLK